MLSRKGLSSSRTADSGSGASFGATAGDAPPWTASAGPGALGAAAAGAASTAWPAADRVAAVATPAVSTFLRDGWEGWGADILGTPSGHGGVPPAGVGPAVARPWNAVA